MEWPFSDRLTISNIRSMTSRGIYSSSTTAFSRNAFIVEQLVYFLLMHTISFLLENDIIMVSLLKDR